jgi:hypothetical protein
MVSGIVAPDGFTKKRESTGGGKTLMDTVFAACDKRSGYIKHTKFSSTNTINDLVAEAVYINRVSRHSNKVVKERLHKQGSSGEMIQCHICKQFKEQKRYVIIVYESETEEQ